MNDLQLQASTDLEISIDDCARVHVLKAEYDLSGVEAHFLLAEHAVLLQVIVKVTAVHQVKDEAELLGRLKCVRHTDDKGRAVLQARQRAYSHLQMYVVAQIRNYTHTVDALDTQYILRTVAQRGRVLFPSKTHRTSGRLQIRHVTVSHLRNS